MSATAPTRPGSWFRRHQDRIDVLVAVALTIGSLVGMYTVVLRDMTFRPPDLLGVLLQLGSTLPVMLRRRYPVTVAIFVSACYMTLGLLGFSSFGGGFATLLAVYSVGAHAAMLPGLLLCVANAGLSLAYFVVHRDQLTAMGLQLNFVSILTGLGQFFAVWIVGRTMQARRIYLEQLHDRADHLERTRAAEVRAALAEERTRVARELHDVVAHHVSVMTVQAAAARRTIERAPDSSREAMQAVEETGRAALSEMRRIVGALRTSDGDDPDDEAALTPRAGVADLGTLLERSRDAGLQVQLVVVGAPYALPTGPDLAIYRVVQESLTNTLRHAGGGRAEVLLRYDHDAVSISVSDEGDAAQSAGPDNLTGHGLIGMRERVALNGGTLHAGPRPHGGFRVEAILPLERAAQ